LAPSDGDTVDGAKIILDKDGGRAVVTGYNNRIVLDYHMVLATEDGDTVKVRVGVLAPQVVDVVVANRAGTICCLYANRNALNIVADKRPRSENRRVCGRCGARANEVTVLDMKVRRVFARYPTIRNSG
jgi:hypothetical protein